MTWKAATLSMLYLIAYGEEPATPLERQQAMDEIRRRKKKRHTITQYREKRKYG